MRAHLRPALVLTCLLVVLTGLAYPGAVTMLAGLLFPRQAAGSLIERDGRVVGSALIGQSFASERYFHPRPSGAGAGYDASASGGRNKGPTDRKLADTLLAQTIDTAVARHGAARGRIPTDLVTASGSGLDPHLSPASADVQAARVARSRGLAEADVRTLVARYIDGRQFGLLGEPRVNVLALNLALDSVAVASGTSAK